ncbi:pyridoxamine 5'-phosphate oxidase family protein [Actinospongicola halichondriae]|uniref:pyridoxamine 5'-phosphate oxidase family protein n=1 Tax=Actinospongicola halichondriae TaxID=3236844 RepID=UPI003D5BB8A1
MSEPRFDPHGLIRMEEADCWEFLRQQRLGRIALFQYHRPLIYPVNYAVDGESVVFRTSRGSKLTAAANEQPVAFEVDAFDEHLEQGTSVIVHGVLTEIRDPSERGVADRLDVRTWAPGDRDHALRVRSQWITGRRFPTPVEAAAVPGTQQN